MFRTKRGGGFTLIELMIVIAIVAILAAILVPNLIRARSRALLTGCVSNVKNIAAAAEMYSTDWDGRFPQNLQILTPNYLKTIPDCPAAGSDTYSSAYIFTVAPDGYEVFCEGTNHGGFAPTDYPRYHGASGLAER